MSSVITRIGIAAGITMEVITADQGDRRVTGNFGTGQSTTGQLKTASGGTRTELKKSFVPSSSNIQLDGSNGLRLRHEVPGTLQYTMQLPNFGSMKSAVRRRYA